MKPPGWIPGNRPTPAPWGYHRQTDGSAALAGVQADGGALGLHIAQLDGVGVLDGPQMDVRIEIQLEGSAADQHVGLPDEDVGSVVLGNAALEAADNLGREGIDCRVLNMSTLKPVDEVAIIQAATDTGAIVTAEEHLEHGGLGSIVAGVLARSCPAPVEFVAIKDTYAESGPPAALLEKYGLTAADIEQAVRRVITRKKA